MNTTTAAKKRFFGDPSKIFRPSPRGDLATSIQKNKLAKIAPTSPRPSVLLEDYSIESTISLTASDIATYELLLSAAYEADQKLTAPTFSVRVADILKFLGPSARRPALKAALKRLTATTMDIGVGRVYEQVPLIVSWLDRDEDTGSDVVVYGFPMPIRELMRRMPGYAHIELAAVGEMKSSYSSKLYKKLALAASKEKWTAGSDNLVVLSGTPEEVADWAGYKPEKGKVTMSRLRERVLNYVDVDLKNLRTFTVSVREHYGTGRGRPVEKIEFRLGLLPPSHHLSKPQKFEKGEHRKRHVGGTDDKKFRVNSQIWTKAEAEFWAVQKRRHSTYFKAWQIALHEALDEAAVSPGYTQRQYRGRRLLNAIADLGPDEAAFKFCAEEVDNPDLLEAASPDLTVDATEAENARKARNEVRNHVRTSETYFIGERNDQNRSVTLPLNSGKHSFARPSPKPAPTKNETSAFEEAGVPEMSDIAADMLESLISSDPVTVDPQEPVLGKNVTLECVREIIWTADRSLSPEELETEIWPAFQIETNGPHTIELTVRAWVNGCVKEFSFGTYNVSPSDIETITRSIGVNIDDELNEPEYLK